MVDINIWPFMPILWPYTARKCHKTGISISGSDSSKWWDLSGYWLDLGGIHLGWSVRAIWTHRNCPRGPPGGSEMAQKCHKTPIYVHKWLRWLQMAGSQWILVGSGWDTSRMVRWGHLDPSEPLMAINGRFMVFFGYF